MSSHVRQDLNSAQEHPKADGNMPMMAMRAPTPEHVRGSTGAKLKATRTHKLCTCLREQPVPNMPSHPYPSDFSPRRREGRSTRQVVNTPSLTAFHPL